MNKIPLRNIFYYPSDGCLKKIDRVFEILRKENKEETQENFDKVCKELRYHDLVDNSYDSNYEKISEINYSAIRKKDLDRFMLTEAELDFVAEYRAQLLRSCVSMRNLLIYSSDIYKDNREYMTDVDQIPFMLIMEFANPVKWMCSDMFQSKEYYLECAKIDELVHAGKHPKSIYKAMGLKPKKEPPKEITFPRCYGSYPSYCTSLSLTAYMDFFSRTYDASESILSFNDIISSLMLYLNQKKEDIAMIEDLVSQDSIGKAKKAANSTELEPIMAFEKELYFVRNILLPALKYNLSHVLLDILLGSSAHNQGIRKGSKTTHPLLQYPLYYTLRKKGIISIFYRVKIALLEKRYSDATDMICLLEKDLKREQDQKNEYFDRIQKDKPKQLESNKGIKLIIKKTYDKDKKKYFYRCALTQDGITIYRDKAQAKGSECLLSDKMCDDISDLVMKHVQSMGEAEVQEMFYSNGLCIENDNAIRMGDMGFEPGTQSKNWVTDVNNRIRKKVNLRKGSLKLFRISGDKIIVNCNILIEEGFRNKDAKIKNNYTIH